MTEETAGQADLKRMVLNVMSGYCVCGRIKNKQGKVCCRQCREGYGSHSILCRKVNGK